jgi:hypothetical protein
MNEGSIPKATMRTLVVRTVYFRSGLLSRRAQCQHVRRGARCRGFNRCDWCSTMTEVQHSTGQMRARVPEECVGFA